MNDLGISEEELRVELDELRPANFKVSLTDEKYEILKLAREHERPVSWVKLSALFESKGWGKISEESLRKHYNARKAKDGT